MTAARAWAAAVPPRVWATLAALVILPSLAVAVLLGAGLSVWRGGVGTHAGAPAVVIEPPRSGLVLVPPASAAPPRHHPPRVVGHPATAAGTRPTTTTVTRPAAPTPRVRVPVPVTPPVTAPVPAPVGPPARTPVTGPVRRPSTFDRDLKALRLRLWVLTPGQWRGQFAERLDLVTARLESRNLLHTQRPVHTRPVLTRPVLTRPVHPSAARLVGRGWWLPDRWTWFDVGARHFDVHRGFLRR